MSVEKVLVIQTGPEGSEALSFIEGLNTPVGVVAAFLPENWLSKRPTDLADYASAAIRVASHLGVPVFAGAQYTRIHGSVRSLGLLALPDGGAYIICEKVHPSRSVGERGRLLEGRLYAPVDVGGLRVACIVCVDIFYPELSRILALEGAILLYNPSSIPGNRIGLWHSMLRARAAENTVYTLGVNKAGTTYPDGRLTGGSSALYTPEGELSASLGGEPGFMVISIDRDAPRAADARRGFKGDLVRYYSSLYDHLRRGLRSPSPISSKGEYQGF